MTITETKDLIIEIHNAYPRHFERSDVKGVITIWQEALKDIEFQYAHKALVEIMIESEFAPSVAEIYKRARQIERYEYLKKGGIIYG